MLGPDIRLDNPLYTNPAYAAYQEDVLVERLGRELGVGAEGAAAKIAALRAEREEAGLGKTSLGKLFAALGIAIATSVRWREECIDPGIWLRPDAEARSRPRAIGSGLRARLDDE